MTDRTEQWQSLVQNQNSNQAQAKKPSQQRAKIEINNPVVRGSVQLHKQIVDTRQLLDKLTNLLKKEFTAFDEQEISETYVQLDAKLNNLKVEYDSLVQISKTIGKGKTPQIITHIDNILTTLNKDIMILKNDFNSVKRLKIERTKHRLKIESAFSNPIPTITSLGGCTATESVINIQEHIQIQSKIKEDGRVDDYELEREKQIHGIQDSLQVIGEMFSKLGVYVSEHSGFISKINDNIEASGNDIERGTIELRRATLKVPSSRGFYVKIISLLFVVVLIVAIFFL